MSQGEYIFIALFSWQIRFKVAPRQKVIQKEVCQSDVTFWLAGFTLMTFNRILNHLAIEYQVSKSMPSSPKAKDDIKVTAQIAA